MNSGGKQMRLWLFGTYKWQGNPKALFLYMEKNYKDSHEVWWISDTKEEAETISKMGYNSCCMSSRQAEFLFGKADVYVTENMRLNYPAVMSESIIILNLWHGVGLKHVELGLGITSALSHEIVKKYVKNYSLYRNNMRFLVTSKFMENHFLRDLPITQEQVVKGPYPRNVVYKNNEIMTIENPKLVKKLKDYKENILFAPTYRYKDVENSFGKLIPNLLELQEVMKQRESLFIIKVHPFMQKDRDYLEALSNKEKYPNILFWDDSYDVYEVFNQIATAIVDYSSIFYDLLEAEINTFIRYIPDYDEYVNDSELIGDYDTYTDGVKVTSFTELLAVLKEPIATIDVNKNLIDKFFEYENECSLDDMIKEIDIAIPYEKKLKELHTFDVFDTLIRRNTITPFSVFYKVQKHMRESKNIHFSNYLIEEYPKVRHQIEMDLRDVFRKTTFERNSEKIEITLIELLERLKSNYNLSDEEVKFLYEMEVMEEINTVESLPDKVAEFFSLQEKGHEVVLVSDMYLEKQVIKKMLEKVDPRFLKVKLYVSSDVGYQKSTGKLFEYIFFDCDYEYSNWIHHGDNKHADGVAPRKYGIQTINHDMDTVIGIEQEIIGKSPNIYRVDSYKVASAIQRYRWKMLNPVTMEFDEELYFAFGYIGTVFVPYVHWAIEDAIERGYKTLYFISRDGYYLKQIADVIIQKLDIKLKTKYIYGSRKAWRVASFINEIDSASFTPFGMFTNMSTFSDMVECSQLEESELIQLVPELEMYRNSLDFKGKTAEKIREIFSESENYQKRLLEIASEKRIIVKEYLQQEINFTEAFAFVEFWGRGYTQDTLTRLLIDASEDSEIVNPFYYIRNFTSDIGNSIRHRFASRPANFSYFETVFAQTPYQSIPGYTRSINGQIEPIIIKQENNFTENITKGIEEFAGIYGELASEFSEGYYRYLAEASYNYQFSNPNDAYISGVFSKFKDNLGMYGTPVEFAPEITNEALKTTSIKEIVKNTRNLEMSLARSTNEVRAKVNKSLGKNYAGVSKSFIINPLERYVKLTDFPQFVISAKPQAIFASVDWAKNSQFNRRVAKDEIVEVIGVEWTKTGVPRLRIADGYITAHKNFIKTFDEVEKIYSKKDQSIFKDSSINNKIRIIDKEEELDVYSHTINTNGQFLYTGEGYVKVEKDNIDFTNVVKEIATVEEMKHNQLSGNEIVEIEKAQGKYIHVLNDSLWLSEPKNSIYSIIDNKESEGIHKVEKIVKSIDGAYYFKIKNKYILADTNFYRVVRNDINDFVSTIESGYYKLKHTLTIYSSSDFKEETKTSKRYRKYTIIKAENIVWTKGGTPRIKTDKGYVSANLNNISKVKSTSLATKCQYLFSKLFLNV